MHREKLTYIVCIVNMILISWLLMHRGKLTDIVVFNAPWKTYLHRVYRQHDTSYLV